MSRINDRGAHFAPVEQRVSKKPFAMAVAMAALALGLVGGTIAYIITNTDDVVNTFTPGTVETGIEETVDENKTTKSNVYITNDSSSSVPVYIRATYVVSWTNATDSTGAGNVSYYAETPEAGKHYSIDYATPDNVPTGWVYCESDGFYYYTSPVGPGKSTSALIGTLTDLGTAPTGYHLTVDVISESIQASPTTAVVDAWGVTLGTDGTSISK